MSQKRWSVVIVLFACLAVSFMPRGRIFAGECTFSLSEASGSLVLEFKSESVPFATATVPGDTVESWDADRITLRDGSELSFSTCQTGFIAIDYRPGNTTDADRVISNFAPLVFTLPGLTDVERQGRLKALGTKGLTAVDGHKGSYLFLALADPSDRHGVVAGWTSANSGSGVLFSGRNDDGDPTLTPQIDYGHLLLTPGSQKAPERLVLGAFDDCRLGLEAYAATIAQEHKIELKRCPSGYCTWYADKFGGACNQIMLPHLAATMAKEFSGFDFIQIDDGWQSGVPTEGPARNFVQIRPDGPYSKGLKSVTDQLKAQNLTTGLWFIPFAGTSIDPWFADKMDLFVRSKIDYPAAGEKNTRRFSSTNQKAGAPYETFWGGTSLDMTNPKARDYLTDIVRRMKDEWGINYFKVDGLWTGMACEQLYVNNEYFPDDLGQQSFYDPTATNVEAYRLGMATLRDAAGRDLFILGCNVSQNMRVMGASMGSVDAMRIGPDNGARWGVMTLGPWHGSNRYFLNGRVWWNDPDPVYVRDAVPLNQAQALASWVALTGQLLTVSDWLPDLSPERKELIRKVIPNHQKTNVRPVDLFDSDMPAIWHLSDEATGAARNIVGLFNWASEGHKTFTLTPDYLGLISDRDAGNTDSVIKQYVAFDFWRNELLPPFETLQMTVPAASCAILSVRERVDHPILLGTSRHIAGGITDVREESWDADTKTLHIVLHDVTDEPTELRIYDPAVGLIRRNLDRTTGPDCYYTADSHD
ncbi:MAG: hypothetical protein Q4G68_15010 [Planctomycetia bacterium]|nr:hypothetical protein [Planctomycetia bacterium]